MQPFSFQLSSFSSLFQDVLNSFLLTVFSLLSLPVTITPCSKTSKKFLTYHSKLFSSPLTHPSQHISRPDLHPPLIHTTYQHLFLNRKHHSCQHHSSHKIQCFQFFLCPSYLLHTWSTLTLRRCLKIAITLFFPFNVDFYISFSLLFYPLTNSLFFSFSFITSASVAPKYLNPFHQFLPLSALEKSYTGPQPYFLLSINKLILFLKGPFLETPNNYGVWSGQIWRVKVLFTFRITVKSIKGWLVHVKGVCWHAFVKWTCSDRQKKKKKKNSPVVFILALPFRQRDKTDKSLLICSRTNC